MNSKSDNKSTCQKVLDKIKKGEIKKHSRIYFILKGFVYGLGIIFILSFSLFLGSFIIFTLRARGALFLPRFGVQGITIFFSSLPWTLILIVLSLILLIEGLARGSAIVYRKPLLYSVLVIVIFVLLGSFILGRANLHNVLFNRAQEHRLPIAGPIYRGYGLRQIKNTHIGEVIQLTEEGFILEEKGGKTFTVVFDTKTLFSPNRDIKLEDLVLVMGEEKEGTILARGVRQIGNPNNIYWRPINLRIKLQPGFI